MKIGLVTPGGITGAFLNWPERRLAAALRRRGHEVRAVTLWDPRVPHLRERRETIDGVPILRVRPRFFAVWRSLSALGHLDVLHVHHLRNDLALPAALYARWRGIPLAFTVHGVLHDPYLVADRDRPLAAPLRPGGVVRRLRELPWKSPRRGWRSYRLHRILYLADRVVALSKHERGVLTGLGVDARRIVVLPQWVEEPASVAREIADRPALLFIGQLKYRKGFDLLLRALPEVCRAHPRLRAYFITQNAVNLDVFEKLVREGGLEGRVELLGQVDETEKWSLLRSVDLYVLPSRYEGFGLPVFEAMRAGCPVVTTRVPVLDELLSHQGDALLAEPESPASLAAEILRALDDKGLRDRMTTAGRRLVEDRYVEATAFPLYEDFYREVARARDGSG